MVTSFPAKVVRFCDSLYFLVFALPLTNRIPVCDYQNCHMGNPVLEQRLIASREWTSGYIFSWYHKVAK